MIWSVSLQSQGELPVYLLGKNDRTLYRYAVLSYIVYNLLKLDFISFHFIIIIIIIIVIIIIIIIFYFFYKYMQVHLGKHCQCSN